MPDGFVKEFAGWTGRQDVTREHIDAETVKRFRATLWDQSSSPQASIPLGRHWCPAPLVADRGSIGPDGYRARGLQLPPIPLPRRMWAAGELRFLDPIRSGDIVERTSRIVDIIEEHGKSGSLCFLTVEHTPTTKQGTAIRERHTPKRWKPILISSATAHFKQPC